MMRSARRAILAMLIASCGGGGDAAPKANMHVGFQMHALECTVEGTIEAKMQVAGIPGFCMLDVAQDRTVSGDCPNIPTGAVRMFRLVYFVMIDSHEVQLATVTTTVDLSGETRNVVTVEFSSDQINTDFDDDGDHVSNIVEVCTGRNPLIMDM